MRKFLVGLLGVMCGLSLTGVLWAESGMGADSKSDASKSCQTAPGGTCAAPASATDAKVAKSAETQPAETKPAETKPAETKPAETKPAETKPAEAKPAQAAESQTAATSLQVEEVSIATGVENRAPVGAAESFPAATEKLYCYTKLTGGKEGDTIVHKWTLEGQTIAEVTLKVNGSPWRTFSSKTVAGQTGKGSVEILQNGTVLKTVNFEITK